MQEHEHQFRQKLSFLVAIRDGVHQYATHGQTLQEFTRNVFDGRELVDWLSFGDGWLSMITGSDFPRGDILESFLRNISVVADPKS